MNINVTSARSKLGGCPGIIFPPLDTEGGEVLQWTDVLVERRDVLRAAFDAAQMGSRAFWHPLHTQRPYHTDDAHYAASLSISKRGLWLPSAFSLTAEQAHVVAMAARTALA